MLCAPGPTSTKHELAARVGHGLDAAVEHDRDPGRGHAGLLAQAREVLGEHEALLIEADEPLARLAGRVVAEPAMALHVPRGVQVGQRGPGRDEALLGVVEIGRGLDGLLDPSVAGRGDRAGLAAVDRVALDRARADDVVDQRHVQVPVPVVAGIGVGLVGQLGVTDHVVAVARDRELVGQPTGQQGRARVHLPGVPSRLVDEALVLDADRVGVGAPDVPGLVGQLDHLRDLAVLAAHAKVGRDVGRRVLEPASARRSSSPASCGPRRSRTR